MAAIQAHVSLCPSIIPRSKVASVEKYLRNGDIVRHRLGGPLRLHLHVGMIVKRPDGAHFMHATSSRSRRSVRDARRPHLAIPQALRATTLASSCIARLTYSLAPPLLPGDLPQLDLLAQERRDVEILAADDRGLAFFERPRATGSRTKCLLLGFRRLFRAAFATA